MKNYFEGIPATSVSDGLGGKNHMDYSIKPLGDYHLSGPALTVDIDAGENISVLEAIYNAKPGDVLVIDGKGGTSNAIAGDFIINLAKTVGAAGVVADGVIRDSKGCAALDFPIFCKGTTTAASKKNTIGSINKQIQCGGVEVNPGDYIVGDIDGVVVVPKNQVYEVQQKSLDRLKRDEQRDKQVGNDINAARQYIENVLDKSKK